MNSFTNAGWCAFEERPAGTGRDGWVGWLGIGGSVLQWHPGCKIGFGFASNAMHLIPTNERAAGLQEQVKQCSTALRRAAGESKL